LISLWQLAWTEDDKIPSSTTIRRRMDEMTAAGQLVLLEENKRIGNLYRLPDPDTLGGEPDDGPTEVADTEAE